MRGSDIQQAAILSYLSPEQRVPAGHPLRKVLDLGMVRMNSSLIHFFESLSPKEEGLLFLILGTICVAIGWEWCASDVILCEGLTWRCVWEWTPYCLLVHDSFGNGAPIRCRPTLDSHCGRRSLR
jgi:hypothetical protein